MAGFLARMLRASLLDTALYEEVEADTGATWQAVGVDLQPRNTRWYTWCFASVTGALGP